MRAISETPRFGYSTVTPSVTNWKASRSPLQIRTSMPASRAWVVRVAMTSSASYPSSSTTGTRSAASTSCTRLIWPLKSVGVWERFALYSA